MARRFLIVLLACGAVWMSGLAVASAHDDKWTPESAESWRPGPPDVRVLGSYGEWVHEPEVGRVWRPYVEADWRPYWRGHWAWRGDWVWVSADPWGDGPFHYGEWAWSDRLGWIWIPGTVWAPARVTWIVSGSVVAWAPTSVHITFGGGDPRWWVYSDARTFRGRVVHPYRVPPAHARIRGGVATRDLGRVFVPETPRPAREFRAVMKRDDRRPDHSDRRADRRGITSRSSSQERTGDRGAGKMRGHDSRARGFDLRNTR